MLMHNSKNFDDLYNYSVSNIPDFWRRVWEFTPLIHEGGYSEVSSCYPHL